MYVCLSVCGGSGVVSFRAAASISPGPPDSLKTHFGGEEGACSGSFDLRHPLLEKSPPPPSYNFEKSWRKDREVERKPLYSELPLS